MLFLALLVTAALGSPYDYEYYDPATGQTLPPAPKPAGTYTGSVTVPTSYPQVGGVIGSPQVGGVISQPYTPLGSSVSYGGTIGTPYGGTVSTSYGGTVGTPYGAGVTTFGSAVPAGTTIYGGSAYGGAVVGGSSVIVQGGAGYGPRPANLQAQSQQANLQQLQAEASFQSKLHTYNSRVVTEASQDQTRLNLFDTLLNPGGHSDGFAILRFRNQARTVDALRSEKRIAAQNADLAYQRYRQDPSRLNMLVSKYSDMNEQLRDASLQYNVVNAGTFGQTLHSSFTLLGGSSLTSLLVSRQESTNLQDIQRRMKRTANQITQEVKAKTQQQKAVSSTSTQGSAAQRLVAMNSYGPSRPF